MTTPIPDPSPSAALEFQFKEARLASACCTTSHDGLRGQYTPHAYIGNPYVDMVRMFRVRFPVLALMSIRDRNAVLMFDLVDGTLLHRISFGMERIVGAPQGFTPPPVSDRVVMDIDVSERWVSVCLHSAVIIVPRDAVSDDGQTAPTLVLAEDDPPQLLQDTAMQLKKIDSVQEHVGSLHMPQTSGGSLACVPGIDAMQKFRIVPPDESVHQANNQALVHIGGRHIPQCFVAGTIWPSEQRHCSLTCSAARFSPDGRHLAAVTVFGLLYIIPDFARVASGAATFGDIAKRVYMGEWLRDLSWEGQTRRLAVQTVSSPIIVSPRPLSPLLQASEELYLVSLDGSYHSLHAPPPSRVPALGSSDLLTNMTVYHLTDFSNPDLGWARARGVAFSGVQLTRTMLWMIWDLALLKRAVSQQRRSGRRSGSRDREHGVAGPMPCEYIACLLFKIVSILIQPIAENGSVCFISFTPGLERGGRIDEAA